MFGIDRFYLGYPAIGHFMYYIIVLLVHVLLEIFMHLPFSLRNAYDKLDRLDFYMYEQKNIQMSLHFLFFLGLLKLCTVGFFFIGQLVDFLLIVVQAVGPSDQSGYYGAFYGPLLLQANTTDPYLDISDSPCL